MAIIIEDAFIIVDTAGIICISYTALLAPYYFLMCNS